MINSIMQKPCGCHTFDLTSGLIVTTRVKTSQGPNFFGPHIF